MAATELDDRYTTVLKTLLVAYVVLVVYTLATNDPLASLLVDVVFSVAMVVVGGLILATSQGETLGVTTGVAFAGSGVAQAVDLVIGSPTAATTSNVLLLAGLGLYLYGRSKQRAT